MKTSNVVLLAAAGYGVWYVSQMGVAAGTVQFVFDGVRILGLTNFEVTMLIQNVSNINLNINSLSGDIFLNDYHIGSMGNFNGQQVVPSNGQLRVPITVSPDLLSLPFFVKNIISNGVGSLDFMLKGVVNANGLVIPFEVTKAIRLS